MVKGKMKTEQGYGTGIGGCKGLCPAVNGASLVTLFSLFVSVKDQPLHWILVRSQTYYPKHILAYKSRKARYALVMGFGSFQTD